MAVILTATARTIASNGDEIMLSGQGTVFVLGAGFTKAFLPNAPLLVDDYEGERLLDQFQAFPEAHAILEMELTHPDHPGKIDLEQLMTRLTGGMPYDFGTGAEQQFEVLLSEAKQAFRRRLKAAQQGGTPFRGDLELFATHCCREHINCLTFNYDDLLDQALWDFFPRYTGEAWCPDWGYGFPCRSSEACIRDRSIDTRGPGPMRLYKLHGSINWRIPFGYPRPYALDALRHHEEWFKYYDGQKVPLADLEPLLEPDPFFVPPVLTKTELVDQPILRRVWSEAVRALQAAERVVFIGYSLPVTDIAAGFLFREGLRKPNPAKDITVVDFAPNQQSSQTKIDALLPGYRRVFPGITEAQFDLRGAQAWVSNNLTEWLFDSAGQPVAFLAANRVFSRSGQLVGDIRSYSTPDAREVWHNSYQGEIVHGNRLLYKEGKLLDQDRGPAKDSPPPSPPRIPEPVPPESLPPGWRDAEVPA